MEYERDANVLLVIPSVNGGKLLSRMLPSLQVPYSSVLVIDQGSTDSTKEVCGLYGVEILQLSEPVTFTKACNIGISVARNRGCEFVLLANNDIVFVNDVLTLLMAEMSIDRNLAIVAPAQQLVGQDQDVKVAYRVKWDLTSLDFTHDYEPPTAKHTRIESDFCELTCALIRVSALDEVGDLDDNYGFYHEDADLGFRMRLRGYSCAYQPSAQIIHYQGSTILERGAEVRNSYISKNKRLFSQKFCGYGFKHADHGSRGRDSWSVINRFLHKYLIKFGLYDDRRPELLFSHPGVEPQDYLYTVWETSAIPLQWRNFLGSYRAVFSTSRWCCDVLRANGFGKVGYVPLGIETDLFQPEGPFERLFEEKTFLWFANNQYRKGLDVMLSAWRIFRRGKKDVKLILLGSGISEALGIQGHAPLRLQGFYIREIPADKIVILEPISPISENDIAAIYRAIDVCVVTSRSEGFGFVIAEAMACAKLVVFPDYSGCSEFVFEGALSFKGRPILADYSDRGYSEVGHWWEPDIEDLVQKMCAAYHMTDHGALSLGKTSMFHIRNKFTWRNTCFYLRAELENHQERNGNFTTKSPIKQIFDAPENLDFAMSLEEAKTKKRKNYIRHQKLSPSRGFDGFDPTFYADSYPDIVEEGFRPLQHFIEHGWKEDRKPSPYFSTRQLIAANPDARSLLLKHEQEFNRRRQLENRLNKNPLTQWLSRRKAAALNAALNPKLPLFIGYFEAALGLGESSRGMSKALESVGYEFSIHPFKQNVDTRFLESFMPTRHDLSGPHEINIFELAPDQLTLAVNVLGRERLLRSYNVLRGYCELPRAPEDWRPMLSHIHEIWAPTRYVAESFSYIFDGPIYLVPPHVNISAHKSLSRRDFHLKDQVFYFLFSFDYYSASSRKNPLGVVRAFQRAFENMKAQVSLVIKTMGPPELNPEVSSLLKDACRDPRISILEKPMTRDEMLSLLKCIDCYVSLHRSEGFGLGMAESMALGKAVIGTDYSGNVDFLNQESGYPVSFKLRKLRDGEYYSGDHQSWAEPNIVHASELMRLVYEDPEERQKRARAGQELMEKFYGAANVAAIVMDHIERIQKLKT